jgi:uncharacterized protein YcfJ
MQQLRMALSLIVMVPGWALLGGFARLDSQRQPNVIAGMFVGAVIGVFFGLVFGGANGRWLDFVYGPAASGGDHDERDSDDD